MVEWFRALDLKSGGPFQILHPATIWICPQPRWVNSQLESLPPVGILNCLCSIKNIQLLICSVPN